MKKTLKIGLFLGLLLAVVLTGIVGVFWFYPHQIIKAAKIFIPVEILKEIDFQKLSGNPLKGYQIKNLQIHSSTFDLTIPQVKIDLVWDLVLKKRILINNLELKEPKLQLKESPPQEPDKNSPDPGTTRWELMAKNIEIKDGVISPPKSIKDKTGSLTNINTALTFESKTLTIQSAHFHGVQSSITTQGFLAFDPLRLTLKGSSLGFISGTFDIQKSTELMKSQFKLVGDLKDLEPLTKGAKGKYWVEGTSRGWWPHPEWEAKGSVTNFNLNDSSFTKARLFFKGRGIAPLETEGNINISELKQGPLYVQQALASVKGSTKSHTLELKLKSGEKDLYVKGKGSFLDRQWKVKWMNFKTTFLSIGRPPRHLKPA